MPAIERPPAWAISLGIFVCKQINNLPNRPSTTTGSAEKVEHIHSYFFCALALSITSAHILLGPLPIGPGTQIILSACIIAFFGLPHGAFDYILARQISQSNSTAAAIRFHILYAAGAAGVFVAWIIAPAPTLLAFLAASAFHFSRDWIGSLNSLTRLIAGLSIILVPTLNFAPDVALIFEKLSGPTASSMVEAMRLTALVIVPLSIILAVSDRERRSYAVGELIAIIALGLVLPPFLYFAVYFACFHSAKHLVLALRGSPQIVSGKKIQTAIVYTAAAIVFTGPVIFLSRQIDLSTILTTQVFISLAALSAPHMFLIERARRYGLFAN